MESRIPRNPGIPRKKGSPRNQGTERINGFRANCYHHIGGNVEKDLAGYPQTYTEVMMKGATVSVTETISTILDKIREAKLNP